MKIFLLIPIIFYISFIAFNLDALSEDKVVNFFNIASYSVPFLLYVSIFLVSYFIFIFIVFDIKEIFLKRKIDKLDTEVFTLKSRLYDIKEDEFREFIREYKDKLDNFTKEQSALFEKFKSENELDLLKQKSETDRILEKLNLLDKWIFDKIKETFKTK